MTTGKHQLSEAELANIPGRLVGDRNPSDPIHQQNLALIRAALDEASGEVEAAFPSIDFSNMQKFVQHDDQRRADYIRLCSHLPIYGVVLFYGRNLIKLPTHKMEYLDEYINLLEKSLILYKNKATLALQKELESMTPLAHLKLFFKKTWSKFK